MNLKPILINLGNFLVQERGFPPADHPRSIRATLERMPGTTILAAFGEWLNRTPEAQAYLAGRGILWPTSAAGGGGPEEHPEILSRTISVRDFTLGARLIVSKGVATPSILSRELGFEHPVASKLIDLLEAAGLVGPFTGSAPREILINEPDLEAWIGRALKGFSYPHQG